jgi:hypothetical protein
MLNIVIFGYSLFLRGDFAYEMLLVQCATYLLVGMMNLYILDNEVDLVG